MKRRRFIWLLVMLLGPPMTGGLSSELLTRAEAQSPSADDGESRFVRGMRERRLFHLAEAYCARRWDERDLDVAARGRLTVEWIQTLAARALVAPPDQRDEIAAAAHDVARRFNAQYAGHSQAFVVRTQEALTDFALGELARQEAEVDVQAARQLDAALRTSRQAVRYLEQLDQELTQILPQRFRKPAAADELTAEELAGLQHQLRYQAARALRNMALCYPADADDRVATLQRAIQFLDKALQQIPDDEPLGSWLQLERAIALRLLDKHEQCRAALEKLDTDQAPAEVRTAMQVELARSLLAEGQLDHALRVLDAAPPAGVPAPADWLFARLEVLVAQWRAATTANRSKDALNWQKLALAELQRIDSEQGPYWRHRGDLLLIRAGGQGGPVGSDILLRTADRLYQQQKWDEAIAAYDQAAAKAREADDPKSAFSAAYKAALVIQERRQFDEAARRLHTLSLANPRLPEASEAHLQAVWNLAQQLRQLADKVEVEGNVADEANDKSPRTRYQEWLEEHLAQWPEQETAPQARGWLGVFLEEQGDVLGALAAFRGIDASSPLYETALRGAARAWQALLAAARRDHQPTNEATQEAARFFTDAVLGDDKMLPTTWTAAQRVAVNCAALFEIAQPPDGYGRAEKLLRAALAQIDDVDDAWLVEARSLLVVSLAGQPGREEEAAAFLREVSGADQPRASQLAVILSELERVARDTPASRRVALARLRLAAIDQLLADISRQPAGAAATAGRPAVDKAAIERLRADALADAGELSAAVDLLKKRLMAVPQDGDAHQRLAELLLATNDAARWRESLGEWRKIAARSPPRSRRWFDAKRGVVTAQIKLGEKKSAAQLIRFLMETPPGLTGTPYEKQFAELLRASEKK